jgi:hypothetical protein
MKVRLRVILKSGAVLGPVLVPFAEVDGLRAMLWPDAPEPRRAQPEMGGVVHMSAAQDEPELWIMSFARSEVAAIQAEAVFADGEREAMETATEPAGRSRDLTGTCIDPMNAACDCAACQQAEEAGGR